MSRVKLIQDKSDVAPEHHELFEELAALRGRISGPSSIVLYSPELARPWNQISEFLHGRSIVEPQYAELAVCATAREFDCAYVWAAHVPAAHRAGVTDAALRSVDRHADLHGLPPEEASLIRFVRQLAEERRVEDSLFDSLLQAHGARWMVELTAWIGRYAALACILNAFEVAPAPEAPSLSEAALVAETPAGARPPLKQPRLPLLTSPDDVSEADLPIFEAVAEARGSVRGPFALLLYSPDLCRAVLDVSASLRKDRFYPAATRELAVIATARERDCPYVWAAHAPAARKAGVPENAIGAVRERLPIDALPSAERDVIDLVRQLVRSHRVHQELFDRLVEAYGVPGLVELVAVIGNYVFVTTLLNAFEVSPAEGAEALPLEAS